MLWIELFSGLLLLVTGGEALVRGASSLASRLGVSPLLIGLTVVGFGTSTPELVTSVQAALADSPGIAVGNVVGSNIANALLILGVTAILRPFAVERSAFLRDGPALMAATLAVVAIALLGELSRPMGTALVIGLMFYLAFAFRSERMSDTSVGNAASGTQSAPMSSAIPAMRLPYAALWAVGGIAMTVLGARFLVAASINFAEIWGVPDAVIGLTIVAVGTSLPELVTSIIAALRRQGALAFGNVVGSNLYNLLGILGITALVRPIPVPAQIAAVDVWVMLAATVALVVAATTGWRTSRGEGALLLAAYVAYVIWLAMGV